MNAFYTNPSINWDDAYSNTTAISNPSSPISSSDGVRNAFVVEYGGLPASYSITSNAPAISEGSSITFTLDTENVAWGTELFYSISGVQQSDLAGGQLSGTAVVEPRGLDGRATVTLHLSEDKTSEGSETLTLTVQGQSASTIVHDTSRDTRNILFYQDEFYELVTTPVTIDQALSLAAQSVYDGRKGHLVTVTDAAENMFLWQNFAAPYSGNNSATPWIALTDSAEEGLWRWLAGPELGQATYYTSFASGEPNNAGNEDFVVLHWQREPGGWFDYPGTNLQWFIVEYEQPIYVVSASSETVSEGDTLVVNVSTTNVAAGTQLSYILTGAGIRSSDVVGGQLAGTVTVDTDGKASFVIQLVADQTTEGTENLTLAVEGVGASVAVVDSSTGFAGPGLSGLAYHWKSHALLDKVAVQAVDQAAVSATPTQLFDLRAASLDPATGKLTVEVWANPGTTVETIDFTATGPAGSMLSFASALGADWTALSNTAQPGQLLLGAYLSNVSATGLTAPTRLGTLEVQLAAGVSDVQLAFSEVRVGEAAVPNLALGMAGATTGADGTFAFTTLPAGSYGLSATRAAGDGSNGVTSADALAALRLAVGINPNPDPDGAGLQQALKVSPYQFMAADANQDGKVTAADALAILRMAVKLPTAVAQEWFFVEETRDLWNEAAGQSALTRTAATWDRAINATAPSEVSLVGVLKADVNGSWTAPAGAKDLDDLASGYFSDLAQRIGVPLDQFGVYGG